MSRRLPLLLALWSVPLCAGRLRAQTPAAPDTARWTIVLGERHAGEVRAWTLPDGELRYTSKVNDRGRGAELETRIRLGADGMPAMLRTTGVDYYKNPVDERFDLANGHGG